MPEEKLTRQEKIQKLIDYEMNCAMDPINEYRHDLEQKSDQEIDEIYKKEYE